MANGGGENGVAESVANRWRKLKMAA